MGAASSGCNCQAWRDSADSKEGGDLVGVSGDKSDSLEQQPPPGGNADSSSLVDALDAAKANVKQQDLGEGATNGSPEDPHCEESAKAHNEALSLDLAKAAQSGELVKLQEILLQMTSPVGDCLTGALHKAVDGKFVDLVASLLDSGADKDAKNSDGSAPLHSAAKGGGLEMVKLLVTRKADLEVEQPDGGANPLRVAIEEGHEDVVKLLLEHGASKETVNDDLVEACQLCEVEDVAFLLRCGADPNMQRSDGNISLIIAAYRGQLEIAKLLLSSGAKVNAIGEDGCSPLLIVAQKGEVEFVKHLLENSADPKVKSSDGNTPLLCAAKSCNLELAQLLVDKGARLSAEQCKEYEKQLTSAVEKNKEDSVKCLLLCGVSAKAQKKDGRTLVAIANEKGFNNLVKMLAQKGLVKKDKDTLGKQLSEVCASGNEERAKFLLSVGASTEIKNANGCTALAAAVEKGRSKLIKLLMEKGANNKAKTSDGKSLLHFAITNGKQELVQMFKKSGLALTGSEQEGMVAQLLASAEQGNVAQSQIYLDCGLGLNSKDMSSETVLHKAAGAGHLQVTKLLLERKANVQPPGGEYGTTPLFYAARSKHLEVCKLLVANGANAKDSDQEGGAKYEALLAESKKKGK